MTVHSTLHALSTSPKQIAKGSSAHDRFGVILTEASANVYVGGVDVDTVSGTLLSPGGMLTIDLSASDTLYAVAASGSPTVKVLTTRGGYIAP